VKRNLKLLYFLTLGALCLCLTAVPAGAVPVVTGPEITDGTISSIAGDANWTTAPAWNPSSGTVVKLDGEVSCPEGGGDCSTGVFFSVYVTGATPITVTLGGTSTDPHADGTVSFDAFPSTLRIWYVAGGGSLSMAPFTLQIPDSAGYSGVLDITLAPGTVVDLGDESLDLTIEPEPGSAPLLCAGLALVEFLRRKIRR
jgi:hypothetical protein